jgi:hypothetical protein
MVARKQILDIQRAMYERLRSSTDGYFGRPSRELGRYLEEYQREFHRFGVVSSKKELTSRLLQSQIALCGDYHTLSQAQASARECLSGVLAELRRAGRKVVVALEMLPFAHTRDGERYLAGELSEAAFLKAIGFRQSWGFDWKNYKAWFSFCASEGISIVGLNGPSSRGTSPLRVRDRFAARVLAEISAESPDHFVFAFIGDLHLAESHLPGDLKRALAWKGLTRRVLTLHQNQEDLYWKLAERGLEEEASVVRLRRDVYCLMNTAPWAKLQSLLQWGERQATRDGDPFGEIDFVEEIAEVLEVLHGFLGIEEPIDPDFRVCGPKDLGWLVRRQPPGLARAVRLGAVGRFPGHFVPAEKLVFLSDFSLATLAGQAARLLHFQLSGSAAEFLRPRRDFYPFVWREALAFLGACVVNPRLTPGIQAFSPPKLPGQCRTADGVLRYQAEAKAAGSLLGHGLFRAALAGRVSRETLRALFENPFADPAQAKALFLQWSRRLAKRRP